MNTLTILFVVLFFCSCQNSYIINHADFAKKIDIEEKFKLCNIDNEECINLKDIYQYKRGLVLFFWQNNCPCVKRYQSRMVSLFEKYNKENIGFYLIASNNETKESIKKEYNKRNISIPILKDNEGKLAKALKVKGTPASVLLDQKGDVKFIGWIDNERKEFESQRKAYLQNAIDDFLNDRPIENKSSPMFGCPII